MTAQPGQPHYTEQSHKITGQTHVKNIFDKISEKVKS